jgi:hypothetical protein
MAVEKSEKWPCPECGREFKAAAHLRLHANSHQVAREHNHTAALAAKEQAQKAAIAALMASAPRDGEDQVAARLAKQRAQVEEAESEDEEEEFDYEIEIAKEREGRNALARRMWDQSKDLPHKALAASKPEGPAPGFLGARLGAAAATATATEEPASAKPAAVLMGIASLISVPDAVADQSTEYQDTEINYEHQANYGLDITATDALYSVDGMGANKKDEEIDDNEEEGSNGLVFFSQGSVVVSSGKGSLTSGKGKGKGRNGKGGGKGIASSTGSLGLADMGIMAGSHSGKGAAWRSASTEGGKGKGFSRPPPPPNKPAHLARSSSAASTPSSAGQDGATAALDQNAWLSSTVAAESTMAAAPSTSAALALNATSDSRPSSAASSAWSSYSAAAPLSDLNLRSSKDSFSFPSSLSTPPSAAASEAAGCGKGGKGGKGKGAVGGMSLDARRRLRLPPKKPSGVAPLASSSDTGRHRRGSSGNGGIGDSANLLFGSVHRKPPPRPPPELTLKMRQAAWEVQFKRQAAAEAAAAHQQKASQVAAARTSDRTMIREAQAAAYKEW